MTDLPLRDSNLKMFTDGSSFMHMGKRKAGYAVVTLHETVEVEALPSGTSAQKAKLIGLTQVRHLGKGKRVNIYVDSKYAFMVVHVQGAIWKERGLLTSGRNMPLRY